MNQLKKQTQADLDRLQNVTNEQLVQALFDLTEQAYCELKYNSGLTYAKRLTDSDQVGYDFLIKTKFYWQWWKNEWAKRDNEFLETYSAYSDASILWDNYLFQHNICRLKSDGLMQKKTASMVGYAIKEYLQEYKKEGAK